MTLDDIRACLWAMSDAVGDSGPDYEVQHSMEDALYVEFVEFISLGEGDLAEMAREVLKSREIDFPRYCA